MDRRLIATAVVSLAIGAIGGFKFAERKLTKEFEMAVDAEREASRRLYMNVPDNQRFETPQQAVEELVLVEEAREALATYRGEQPEREPVAYHKIKTSQVKVEKKAQEEKPEPVQEENIFAIEEKEGDIVVISDEAFHQGFENYDQVPVTYYTLDDVLCDLQDDKIDDRLYTIGPDALKHFGFLSGDENIVHVRNHKLRMDFEITRVIGSYTQMVHGMEPAGPRPSQSGG